MHALLSVSSQLDLGWNLEPVYGIGLDRSGFVRHTVGFLEGVSEMSSFASGSEVRASHK